MTAAVLVVALVIGIVAWSGAGSKEDSSASPGNDRPKGNGAQHPPHDHAGMDAGGEVDGSATMPSADGGGGLRPDPPRVIDGDAGSSPPLTLRSLLEAARLRADVLAAVERHGWRDPAQVAADGYRVMAVGGRTHRYSEAAGTDGVEFDVDRPEVIVIDDGEVLGVMFLADSFDRDRPPPPGSPLNHWHYHRVEPPGCFDGVAIVGLADATGSCPEGQDVRTTSPPMVHVWLDNVADPFADDMNGQQS